MRAKRAGTRARATTPERAARERRAPERWAALLFFAVPAALPIWGMGAFVAYAASPSATTSWASQVVFLPLAALAGVVGALLLNRGLVLGSAISLALGALLGLGKPLLFLFYALPAALMGLTTRKLKREA